MRFAATIVVVAVAATAGCAGHSGDFSSQQVSAAFAKQGYPLRTKRYFRFGPIHRVQELWWARNGGVRNGILYSAEAFYVLVFRSREDAAQALRDPSVTRYLRVGRIPAIRHGNVVLTPLYNPVDAPGIWERLKAALASLRH